MSPLGTTRDVAGRPLVTYGPGPTTMVFKLAARCWQPESAGVGGSDISGAGVPEVFEVRRDHIAGVTLRFYEHEWSAVREWLEWAQRSGQGFAFRFDQDDLASEHDVYLHRPTLGGGQGGLRPQRSGQFPGVFTQQIALRTVTGAAFDRNRTGW